MQNLPLDAFLFLVEMIDIDDIVLNRVVLITQTSSHIDAELKGSNDNRPISINSYCGIRIDKAIDHGAPVLGTNFHNLVVRSFALC